MDTTEAKEIRAEAAEDMADECHDLIIALVTCSQDWDTVSDLVKDYMHDWAATFRAESPNRIDHKINQGEMK